jgi:hypothetical protein
MAGGELRDAASKLRAVASCQAGSLPGRAGVQRGWSSWLLALALLLAVPLVVAAQSANVAVGSTVRVSGTDGQGLNLRESPGWTALVLLRLPEGTLLEVVGPARQADALRWLNVREPGGKTGWVAADFAAVVSTPTAVPTRAAAGSSEPTPTGVPSTSSATPTSGPEPTATAAPGNALEVDPRVKYPETAEREQTLTVTVTRNGAPVRDVQVVAITQDSDPPLVRELDPTNAEGVTTRSFDIRREKGTVVLVVVAVAPDGGKGNKSVSYFRR